MHYCLPFRDGDLSLEMRETPRRYRLESEGYDLESELLFGALNGKYSSEGLFLILGNTLLNTMEIWDFDSHFRYLVYVLNKRGYKDASWGRDVIEDLHLIYAMSRGDDGAVSYLKDQQVLDKIASLNDVSFKRMVASSRYALPSTLVKLSKQSDIQLLENLCLNPNFPVLLLGELIRRPELLTFALGVRSRNRIVQVHGKFYKALYRYLWGVSIDRDEVYESLYREYINDPNPKIRAGVATHISSSQGLRILIRDKEKDVRMALFENSHLTKWMLWSMLFDEDTVVRQAARSHLLFMNGGQPFIALHEVFKKLGSMK